MENFVMYCKSFSGDKVRLQSLVKTFNKYNKDAIKLYISVPEADIDLFWEYKNKHVEVISDESFCRAFMTDKPVNGIRPGYINQEICKLNFYRTGVCRNYLCLDSDCLFARDFYKSDFMYDDNTPFTVLIMDKDLSIEKFYHNRYWVPRLEYIKSIYNAVGLKDSRLRTCHNSQVFNCEVLASLYNDFMIKHNYSYIDLMKIGPYEFTWYNAYFQKCGLIKELAVEPFFLTFHMQEQYYFARLKNLDLKDISYSYVGIILNNKWDSGTPYEYEPINNIEQIFNNEYLKNPRILEDCSNLIHAKYKKLHWAQLFFINILACFILNRSKRKQFREKLKYLFAN